MGDEIGVGMAQTNPTSNVLQQNYLLVGKYLYLLLPSLVVALLSRVLLGSGNARSERDLSLLPTWFLTGVEWLLVVVLGIWRYR